MPLAPRLARKRSRLRRLREAGLDVADRHRRADPDDRAVGQLGLERGEHLRLERVGRARPAAAARPASASRQRLEPAGSRSAARISTRPPARRARARPRRAGSARRGASARARRRAGRSPPAARPATQARSGFEVGMSPTRSTSSGRVALGEALDAQQHVVVGDHVRAVVAAAAHARGRLGEQRPAARRRPGAPPARPPRSAVGPQTIAPRGGGIRAASAARRRRAGAACSRSSVQGRPSGAALPVGRRRAPRARARAARAAGSSGARAPAARRPRSSRRGRRARGGGSRSRGPGSWVPTSTNHLTALP